MTQSSGNLVELAALLCREGLHSGVWFADKLIEAADALSRLERVTEAARPFAESIVIDPTKQRGDRHWATFGPPTNLDHVLALKQALSTQDEAGEGRG
jgi:hypothetical protein